MTHVHSCPECYERPACDEPCHLEPDLRLDDGTERGHHAVCPDCLRHAGLPDALAIDGLDAAPALVSWEALAR